MFSWCLPLPPSATLGALEFSLLYEQDNSSLHCTIIKAKVGEGAPLRVLWHFWGTWGGYELPSLSPVIALSICDNDGDDRGQGLAMANSFGGVLPPAMIPEGFHLTVAATQE